MAHDLKFHLLKINDSYRGIENNVREELKGVALAFVDNIERVKFLASFPIYISNLTLMMYMSMHVAMKKVHGFGWDTIKAPDIISLGENEEKGKQVGDELNAELIRLSTALSDIEQIKSIEKSNDLFSKDFSELPVIGKIVSNGLESILSSTIVGTWTAFETLAGDLWETAINIHPKELAELAGPEKRIENKCIHAKSDKVSSNYSKKDDEESKKVDLEDIRKISKESYNIENLMGTILREKRSFIKLTEIRRAYSLAFNTREELIDIALSHESLDGLSLLRNLLVHHAGISPKSFVGRGSKIKNVPKLVEKKRLVLDGEIVSNLVNPVIEKSIELIKSVNDYVSREEKIRGKS